jgi:hypothetical protein
VVSLSLAGKNLERPVLNGQINADATPPMGFPQCNSNLKSSATIGSRATRRTVVLHGINQIINSDNTLTYGTRWLREGRPGGDTPPAVRNPLEKLKLKRVR